VTYPEADRWAEFVDLERDEEAEHRAAVELARRERLDEKGGVVPFPKPTKRHRASANEWLAIRDKFPERTCRLCPEPWQDLHHLLPKDGSGTWPGGDDVVDNLIPLCRSCHNLVEARLTSARARVRDTLTARNLDYLKRRIGDRWFVFLDRHYAERAA
jgi:5-methylcytosine-specific restriction endonuclease McrA